MTAFIWGVCYFIIINRKKVKARFSRSFFYFCFLLIINSFILNPNSDSSDVGETFIILIILSLFSCYILRYFEKKYIEEAKI